METPRYWYKKVENTTYLITTDRDLIDLDFITAAFATEDMFWAQGVPAERMRRMLENSCTLSMYTVLPPPNPSISTSQNNISPSSNGTTQPPLQLSASTDAQQTQFQAPEKPRKEDLKQVGLARLVTDYVTFAYLTDVYLDPSHRGGGLGRWLIRCVKEVYDAIPVPGFRRTMLLTSSRGNGVAFYKEVLGMQVFDRSPEGSEGLVVMMTPLRKG